jgi:RimJ/RimL family protein N-acetyltransferase
MILPAAGAICALRQVVLCMIVQRTESLPAGKHGPDSWGRRMIVGKLVALGPILPPDMSALFRWSDDVDEARLNEPYRPHNWQHLEAFWLNANDDRSRVFFAIRSVGDPAIIGYIQIMNVDPVHRSSTIGIRIGDLAHRRQGKGREALSLAIGYCWNHLNLTRIALTVFSHNRQAISLYSSLGFQQEGVLRQANFIDGQWIDVVLMARLHPSRLPTMPNVADAVATVSPLAE